MAESSESHFTLEPNKTLTFEWKSSSKEDLQNDPPKAELIAKNNSGDVMAFKVKTTAPKRFVVRPPQGHIMPESTQRITLTMVPKEASLLQTKYQSGQEEEAKDKFLVQTATLSADFYKEHLEARDKSLNDPVSEEEKKTIKEEQTKIISEMWTEKPKSEITSSRLTTKFVYGSVSDSFPPSPVAPSVDPNTNAAPSAPVPGSPEGLFTELSALRKKYDDLVAYSVDVTADRDRLNGMVQKLKADVKRNDQTTRTVLATNPDGSPAQTEANASSEKVEATGGGFSMVQVLVMAVVAFIVGKFMV